MAAEIFHCDLIGKDLENIQGHLLEATQTFWIGGYGDGKGKDAFIKVFR